MEEAQDRGPESPGDARPDPRWLARLCVEVPAGGALVGCPLLPFGVEASFSMVVAGGAGTGEPQGASAGPRGVVGHWHRAVPGLATAVRAGGAVRLTLDEEAGSEGPRVIAAEGPGHFGRCGAERWILASAGGAPPGSLWRALLAPGVQLRLQRPPERAFVLRSPEEQVSRLVTQLSAEAGARVLAAPVGRGALIVLAAVHKGAVGGPLVPDHVLEELERRFGVVFPDSARRAEELRPSELPEASLRALLAFGARHALRSQGWLSVEAPGRLCLAEGLVGHRRTSVRVPCVDVACVAARASGGGCDGAVRVEAELELRPSVRVVQPLAQHLAREAQEGGDVEALGAGVHVLPRLTPGRIARLWLGRFPAPAELPAELRGEGAFADYWRLIHGLHFPEGSFRSFARVAFGARGASGGLELTYPLACLWRSEWALQPMQTKQHGGRIFEQSLRALAQGSLLGVPQSVALAEASQPQGGPARLGVPSASAPPGPLLPLLSQPGGAPVRAAARPGAPSGPSGAPPAAAAAAPRAPLPRPLPPSRAVAVAALAAAEPQPGAAGARAESAEEPAAAGRKRRRLLLPLRPAAVAAG